MKGAEKETIDPELAHRLKQIYRLPREPTSADDYYALIQAGSEKNPKAKAYLQKMRRGQVVMGETTADRGYSVDIPERGRVNVMCGYDAVITAVLRGEGRARGDCRHCGEPMDIRIENGQVAKVSPTTTVFWLGAGPPDGPGHPVCDHLHLFPSHDHLSAWLDGQPGELGFEIPLADLVEQATRADR